jgi:hypothetical protein
LGRRTDHDDATRSTVPTTVQSVNPFNPFRWIGIAVCAVVVAYFIGYAKGQDADGKTEPPPTTTVTRSGP